MLKQHKKIKRKKVKIVKGKKLLAALLSICMVLTLLPAMALAEGTAAQLPEVVDGVITLTSDVILEDTVSFDSGAITIDLNGYTLTSVGAENVDSYAAPVNKTVIKVSETADVTITDSATEKGMVIAGSMTNCRPAPQSTLLVEGGTLTIDGAVVKGATTINCRDTGEAIEVIGNETCLNVINGSKIIGSDDITDDSKDSNYGSKGNTYGATAIYAKTDGVITITDSEVIGGKGVGSSRNGGVGISMSVYSYKGGAGNPYTDVVVGTLNISSSIIKGGDSEQKNSEGEAINAASQGLIEDSDIIGGSAKGIGGTAVYVGSIAPVSKFVNCNIIGGNGETSWPGTGMEIFAAGGVEAENCIISGGEGMGESSYGGALWFYTETREPIHLKNCELVIVSDVVTAAIGGTATGKSSISTEGTLKIKRTGKDTLPSDVVRSYVQITWLNNPNLRYADATGTEYRSTDFKIGDTTYFTLSEALDNAQEGDTITIMPGVYTEGFDIPKGKNNITIEGTVGEDGELLTEIQAENAVHGEYITIRNIKFNKGTGTLIKSWYGGDSTQNGDNITVENCEFYGSGNYAISLSTRGVVKNVILDNFFRGIHFGFPENVLIDGAKITRAVYGVHAADPKGNSTVTLINSDIDCTWANSFTNLKNLTIEGNIFRCTEAYYADPGVSAGVNTYSPNTTIKNNVFLTNSRIILNTEVNKSNVGSVKISHNYFADGIDNAFWPDDNYVTTSVLPAYLDEAMTILSNVQVVDSVADGNITVSVPKLFEEAKDSLADNSVFRVSVKKTVPSTNLDDTAINEGEKAEYIDISLLKNNEKVDPSGPQTVILTLSEPIVGSVTVYHWNGTSWDEVPSTYNPADNTISFTTSSFSPFAIVYGAGSVAAADIATEVAASLEQVTDNEYNIVLTGKDGKMINRFMSAELSFTYAAIEGSVAYEIEGASNVIVTPAGTVYGFSMDGIEAAMTGNKLVIGKAIFEGRGKGTFNIASAGAIINTAESEDNIVTKYTAADSSLTISSSPVNIDIVAPTQMLTVQVKFNNKISDNAPAYQDMKITISGGDLTSPITFDLGGALVSDAYTVTQDLTKDLTYTVTISGAGYRTARYNVNMSVNKTLNFWNNVKDAPTVVEVGAPASTATKNFLAGDIVKDNNINLYDLSAVVSYFGMIDLSSDPSKYKYAKYDLNRDGKIDSKDVAYVLVSWDN